MRSPQVRAREPGRVELKRRYFPSGENRGFELSVLGDVKRVASPPLAGTTQTSLWRLFSLSRTVVTVNATSLPSGETVGAASVVTLYQSAGVNARRAVAAGACVDAARLAVAGRCCAEVPSAGTSSAAIAKADERIDVLLHECCAVVWCGTGLGSYRSEIRWRVASAVAPLFALASEYASAPRSARNGLSSHDRAEGSPRRRGARIPVFGSGDPPALGTSVRAAGDVLRRRERFGQVHAARGDRNGRRPADDRKSLGAR